MTASVVAYRQADLQSASARLGDAATAFGEHAGQVAAFSLPPEAFGAHASVAGWVGQLADALASRLAEAAVRGHSLNGELQKWHGDVAQVDAGVSQIMRALRGET